MLALCKRIPEYLLVSLLFTTWLSKWNDGWMMVMNRNGGSSRSDAMRIGGSHGGRKCLTLN